MQANGARHLFTIWQHKTKPWCWWALKYGHAQPRKYIWGFRNRRVHWFHLTPIHYERWANEVEIGLCIGRRTVYLMRHS